MKSDAHQALLDLEVLLQQKQAFLQKEAKVLERIISQIQSGDDTSPHYSTLKQRYALYQQLAEPYNKL